MKKLWEIDDIEEDNITITATDGHFNVKQEMIFLKKRMDENKKNSSTYFDRLG
jgi:hypothetical protein